MTTEQGPNGEWVRVPDDSDISMDIIGPILRGEKVYSDFVPNDFGDEPKKPKIVCLCGSTRFYNEFQKANYLETMNGNIVLSVGFFLHAQKQMHGEDVGCTVEQKVALDELHKRKIDLADEILVINVHGYVGDSTRSEIEYARTNKKEIRYLEPLHAGQLLTSLDIELLPTTTTTTTTESKTSQQMHDHDRDHDRELLPDHDSEVLAKRLAGFRALAGAFPDMEFPDREPVDMLERLFEMQSGLNNYVFLKQGLVDRNQNHLTMTTLLESAKQILADDSGKATVNSLTVEWLTKYVKALSEEVGEVGEALPWKFWSKSVADLDHVQEEIVDALHFWISLSLVSGMDARAVFQKYLDKNRVNLDRQNQGYVAKGDISNVV